MDIEAIASEAFAVLETGRQIAPFSKVCPSLGPGEAYRVTAAVRAKREARGERPIWRKIGFTNRTIWSEYGFTRRSGAMSTTARSAILRATRRSRFP